MRIRYDKTVWVDNETPVDACRLNKIENALEQLFTLAISPSQIEAGNGITIKILDNGNIKFSVSSEPVLDILKAGPGIKIEKVEDDNTIKISSNLDSGNYIDFDLDEETGKITISSKKQIEEYETTEDFPETGESNILYVEKENDKLYYWKEDEYKNLNKDITPLQNTTWENLVELRDNSKLIPGTFYRITNYVTTTKQKDTKSANHQFDIIVRADSENTLNENASAIQHEGDTYFQNCKLESWELKYCLDNDTDRFSWAIESGDYIYVSNWLTEKATLDGTTEVDGETYYKWLRNDPNDENPSWFLTKTDDFSNASYENPIKGITGVIFIYNREEGEEITYTNVRTDENIIAFTDENNIKTIWTNTLEKVLYDGITEIDGETYHKWKKLDSIPYWYILTENGPGSFTDASVINNIQYDISGKICIETDNEYIGGSNEKILGEAFLQGNGKGVIYYMKDEWNNECPFDFKNILFTRNDIWFLEHDQWAVDVLGENPKTDMHFYFLSLVNEDKEVQDLSIVGQELIKNRINYYGNIIKCVYNAVSTLPCTIIVNSSTYYTEISSEHYGCYNNIFENNCIENTFGNNCNNNIFMNNCYHNTLNNNCSFNTFGYNCVDNILKNNCYFNTFGNNCNNNIFSSYSQYITVFDKVCWCQVSGGTDESAISNAQILSGTHDSLIYFTPGELFTQVAAKTSNDELKIWNPADLV